MKPSIFNENDSVLLIGEGNFSFSVALLQLDLKINITATCYENSVDREAGKKNIEYLMNNGVRVLLGVDGTKLKEHSILQTESFDKIIFNFPHVGGKMRIEKNRELLKNFFIAAEKSIRSDGLVLVTLCNGQGGTPLDNPQRRWDDSWKVTEMAAHGNLILTKVESFMWKNFESYIVTGYRSLDKEFYSEGALTHIFAKSEPPDVNNIAPGNKLNIDWCNFNDLTWRDLISKTITTSSCRLKSLYPPVHAFDITFRTNKEFDVKEFYIVLYNHAGCIINDINFVRSYMSPYEEYERETYRISYKSSFLPLYRKRVINIHQNVIAQILEDNLNVTVIR